MTRDQFLTEWLGECWHEWQGIDSRTGEPGHWPDGVDDLHQCVKCKKRIRMYDNGKFNDGQLNFSTWDDFGKLLVHSDRFATAWAKFKGWKEETCET